MSLFLLHIQNFLEFIYNWKVISFVKSTLIQFIDLFLFANLSLSFLCFFESKGLETGLQYMIPRDESLLLTVLTEAIIPIVFKPEEICCKVGSGFEREIFLMITLSFWPVIFLRPEIGLYSTYHVYLNILSQCSTVLLLQWSSICLVDWYFRSKSMINTEHDFPPLLHWNWFHHLFLLSNVKKLWIELQIFFSSRNYGIFWNKK